MGCAMCGEVISEKRARRRAKYCSHICLRKSERERWAVLNEGRSPNRKGQTGATHKLMVCVDLMWKGYEVFRALSPDCPCDMIVMKDGEFLRVQVTTGYKNKSDAITYPHKDPSLYDLLAVIVNGEICYNPTVSTKTRNRSI